MNAGSGLATGTRPHPELAAEAVHRALARAGLQRAEQVILFLTRDFIRNPQPAIIAAARAAGCLQVTGCTASGVLTETDWQSDQPAAAALVFSPECQTRGDSPILSFSGQGHLPFDWHTGALRAGLIDTDAVVWTHGHLATHSRAEMHLPGLDAHALLACGLRPLGREQRVTSCDGYELRRLGTQAASDSLLRALPAELREHPPLHQLSLLRQSDGPGIAILSANADGSLTLAEALTEGETLGWAIRQPLAAEQEIRELFAAAVDAGQKPDFALMFSCIGRGPLFYGDDDRDRRAFCDTFPGVPLLGAYGTGQIAAAANSNRLFHNTALTLLFESIHVQSDS